MNRPEVRQAEDKRLAADIDRVFAANQSLPQADLQLQYLSNGFAGILTPVPGFLLSECSMVSQLTTCPTPPPNTQGKMAWAYHNLWAGYFPTFNTALVVSYPIQGNLARGMRGVASEEETQARLLMQGVEERIGAQARNALQSYQSALANLNAARKSREAAEAVYASEVRRFHRGSRRRFWCSSAKFSWRRGVGWSSARKRSSTNQLSSCSASTEPSFPTTASTSRHSAPRRSRIKMPYLRTRAVPAALALAALVLATLPVERTSAQSDDSLPRRATLPTPIPTPSLAPVPNIASGYRAPKAEPSNPGIIGVTEDLSSESHSKMRSRWRC